MPHRNTTTWQVTLKSHSLWILLQVVMTALKAILQFLIGIGMGQTMVVTVNRQVILVKIKFWKKDHVIQHRSTMDVILSLRFHLEN